MDAEESGRILVGAWRDCRKSSRIDGYRNQIRGINNLYFSPHLIRVIKSKKCGVVGTCSMHGSDEKYIQRSVG